jgi:hypothetical protein
VAPAAEAGLALQAKQCYNLVERIMAKKARTPIVEYEDTFAIEILGDDTPQERDRLTDQGIVVAYDRRPGGPPRWRLRALYFDRDQWTRSGIRRWWAAHEVHLLAQDQMYKPVPEVCRSYPAPRANLPTIILSHRNTPLVSAKDQLEALGGGRKG